MTAQREWTGTTYGSRRLLESLIRLLRHVDTRVCYAFSSLFVIPVVMLLSRSRHYVYLYFRRHLGMSRLQAAWNDYRGYCLYGKMLIDKFAMYAGRRFDIKIEGGDNFNRLASGKDGFEILSSHIGCYEMAGYSLCSDHKPFNALVFSGEKATVMENRLRMFSSNHIKMIPVKSDMSHLFHINSAFGNGEIVSLPADRLFGSTKHFSLSFLGAQARFPAGPFILAAMHGVEVIAVNVMKTGVREYTVYVTPLNRDQGASQKEQARQLAANYVKELEKMVRRYPRQWFNYYDFWQDGHK